MLLTTQCRMRGLFASAGKDYKQVGKEGSGRENLQVLREGSSHKRLLRTGATTTASRMFWVRGHTILEHLGKREIELGERESPTPLILGVTPRKIKSPGVVFGPGMPRSLGKSEANPHQAKLPDMAGHRKCSSPWPCTERAHGAAHCAVAPRASGQLAGAGNQSLNREPPDQLREYLQWRRPLEDANWVRAGGDRLGLAFTLRGPGLPPFPGLFLFKSGNCQIVGFALRHRKALESRCLVPAAVVRVF